jgi:hypothetical protein
MCSPLWARLCSPKGRPRDGTRVTRPPLTLTLSFCRRRETADAKNATRPPKREARRGKSIKRTDASTDSAAKSEGWQDPQDALFDAESGAKKKSRNRTNELMKGRIAQQKQMVIRAVKTDHLWPSASRTQRLAPPGSRQAAPLFLWSTMPRPVGSRASEPPVADTRLGLVGARA